MLDVNSKMQFGHFVEGLPLMKFKSQSVAVVPCQAYLSGLRISSPVALQPPGCSIVVSQGDTAGAMADKRFASLSSKHKFTEFFKLRQVFVFRSHQILDSNVLPCFHWFLLKPLSHHLHLCQVPVDKLVSTLFQVIFLNPTNHSSKRWPTL
jgi:hypothetical protein